MYQQLLIIGVVANEPEMRYTPAGIAVVHLSIPLSKYKGVGADGQPQYATIWVDVTAWRNQAEYIGNYVSKNDRVVVAAELEDPQVWVSASGDLKGKNAITAQFIRKLNFGTRQDAEGLNEALAFTAETSAGTNEPGPLAATPGATKAPKKPGKVVDTDIPF